MGGGGWRTLGIVALIPYFLTELKLLALKAKSALNLPSVP